MEVLQVPSELAQMMKLHKRRKPLRVLEIGCWDGGTLREWLTNAQPGSVVVAVDLEHRNRDAYEGWRKPDTTLVLGTGESQSDEMKALIRKHAPYDWVFIDGDHGDWGVGTDVATCLPCMAPGGVMLMHDVSRGVLNEGDPAPRIMLEELRRKRFRIREFVEEPYGGHWAHGIGVVYIPKARPA